MNDVLTRKIKRATKDLETLMKRSKRKLFELETISSALDLVNGRGKIFKNTRELLDAIQK